MSTKPEPATDTSLLRRYLSRAQGDALDFSWLFHYPHALWGTALQDVQDRSNTYICYADGNACASLGGCLSSLGQALGFPQYYGKNPDAFIECLGDLLIRTDSSFLGSEFGDRLGVDREAVLLVVDPGMGFLSRANSSERDSFFSIIDAVIMEPLTPDFMGSETADEDPTARSVPFAVAMII